MAPLGVSNRFINLFAIEKKIYSHKLLNLNLIQCTGIILLDLDLCSSLVKSFFSFMCIIRILCY